MKDLRTMSHVPRWGVLRVIKRQSLADHSYYVAVYASLLLETMKDVSVEEMGLLLQYCLMHDLPEVFTTDIPGPVKRSVCESTELKKYENEGMLERFGFMAPVPTRRVRIIAKVADILDEICYLHSEIQLGNKEAYTALRASQIRLDELLHSTSDSMQWTKATLQLIYKIRTSELGPVNLPKG